MPEPSKLLRVLVVDDHPIVRAGLRAVITGLPDMEIVGTAAAEDEAVELAVAQRPDVVVMDLTLLDGDGVEATRRIVRALPEVAVLALTMHDADEMLFAAIRAGARGYLVKGATHDVITHAVRSVARGEAVFGQDVARRVLDDVARRAATPLPQLTDREREIVRLLSIGRGTSDIASRLFLSPKTVRNHVSNILTKLAVDDRAQAVALARDAGILARPKGPGGSDTSLVDG